jgi:hypothetical protein
MKTLCELLDDLTRDGWESVADALEMYRDTLAGWIDQAGRRGSNCWTRSGPESRSK